jgi:hypothetical protein
VSVELDIVASLHPFGLQDGTQVLETLGHEGWVGLPRRCEAVLDPEMQLAAANAEPAATPLHEVRGLGDLGKAEEISIEVTSAPLPTRRNGHLHVVEAQDRH